MGSSIVERPQQGDRNKSLCLGCCVLSLCFGHLHSGFSNHRELHGAIFEQWSLAFQEGVLSRFHTDAVNVKTAEFLTSTSKFNLTPNWSRPFFLVEHGDPQQSESSPWLGETWSSGPPEHVWGVAMPG